MSVVAIIPARGGSKGVPGKNLRRVGGVPLIARTVIAARSSLAIDRVVVSTDDAAIAAVARSAGAEIVDRPAVIAGDTASSESALLHALEELGERPDVIVFLQATSPFIRPADLDEAVARVERGDEDVVFSAVETFEFLWSVGAYGATGVNHDHRYRPRRQEREPHYRETGAFYVMRADGFRSAAFRFFGRVGVAAVDERASLEIDTLEELELANALAPALDSELFGHAIDVDAVITDFDGRAHRRQGHRRRGRQRIRHRKPRRRHGRQNAARGRLPRAPAFDGGQCGGGGASGETRRRGAARDRRQGRGAAGVGTGPRHPALPASPTSATT